MVSGWLIVMAALLLLSGANQRLAFILSGLLIEILGIALLAWHYRSLQRGAA
jgi:type IV secretory pathway TrbD component